MAVTATTTQNITVVEFNGGGGLPLNIFVNPNPTAAPVGGHVTQERFRIKVVRWVAETAAAGNNVVLTDVLGNKVWESTASGANFTDSTNLGDEFRNGLVVTAMDAGTLYLYHGLA